MTAITHDEAPAHGPSLRRLALAGLATMALGFGGLGAWAAVARLESAVPASGTLVVQSKRKTVSLLESGILRELLVAEGSSVAGGQPLLRLDDSQARAMVAQARARQVGAEARVARLAAELDERDAFVMPQRLGAMAADDTIAPLLAAEKALFEARGESFRGAVAVQQRRTAQLEQQIAALRAQGSAHTARLGLIRQELRGVNDLLSRGFATRTRALELQRAEAQLVGEIGELEARAAEAGQAIAQAEHEMLNLRTTRRNESAREMQDAVAQVAEGRARLAAAEDILSRTIVLAPEAGVVTDLRFFTAGSSIGAGQPVLDIVPSDDTLLVEAAINPGDIERIAPGSRVNVRLTGFSHRRVPPLPGHLVYVGADRQVNSRGDTFFLLRATLDPGALAALPEGVSLSPGMPADVLVIGAERSALDYLLSPILDSMRRAMREE
ncbi:HlyD family type I secretion periplasmic adaptor subunit [Elioraea sp.]|uniref:HlyD family type I secretion periplasmic adaptor subunit n=1 Tax=Elioraea sp. TaxID=2185103 RepID=UPI0025BD6A85|nr:HlyD family type I secretion periplasmic adaptor subunit [Elioraea sp.]